MYEYGYEYWCGDEYIEKNKFYEIILINCLCIVNKRF